MNAFRTRDSEILNHNQKSGNELQRCGGGEFCFNGTDCAVIYINIWVRKSAFSCSIHFSLFRMLNHKLCESVLKVWPLKLKLGLLGIFLNNVS